MRGPGERTGNYVLSEEHSRRLAQLERQLRRDDPDFCARMRALAGPDRRSRNVWLQKVATAIAMWVAALVLGVIGWWIPAAIAAILAAAVVAGVIISQQ
jgi:hypothetical protein